MPATAIRTDRLTLRPINASDVPAVVAGLGNYEVSRWLASVPHPFTAGDVRLCTPDGAPLWPDYAIIDLGGLAIGGVKRGARLGFWLSPDHWGRGFMTEATGAALTATFEETDLDEIGACVFDGNTASARVLEKQGFDKAGHCAEGSFCAARRACVPKTEYILRRSTWEGRA